MVDLTRPSPAQRQACCRRMTTTLPQPTPVPSVPSAVPSVSPSPTIWYKLSPDGKAATSNFRPLPGPIVSEKTHTVSIDSGEVLRKNQLRVHSAPPAPVMLIRRPSPTPTPFPPGPRPGTFGTFCRLDYCRVFLTQSATKRHDADLKCRLQTAKPLRRKYQLAQQRKLASGSPRCRPSPVSQPGRSTRRRTAVNLTGAVPIAVLSRRKRAPPRRRSPADPLSPMARRVLAFTAS